MPIHPSFPGLSPHLVAEFYPMHLNGDGTYSRDEFRWGDTEPKVLAPLTQAVMDIAVNWNSPFESTGIGSSRVSTLSQLVQSGMMVGLLNAIGEKSETLKKSTDSIAKKLAEMSASSGITKVNSIQTFNGMPPVKLQVTAFFRAFGNAANEVEGPIRQLQGWALPQELAPDGLIAQGVKSEKIDLMPSKQPRIVGMNYKNRQFFPMVIESISDPLDGPIDKDGNRISASISLTICSLTAWDNKTDWPGTFKNL